MFLPPSLILFNGVSKSTRQSKPCLNKIEISQAYSRPVIIRALGWLKITIFGLWFIFILLIIGYNFFFFKIAILKSKVNLLDNFY